MKKLLYVCCADSGGIMEYAIRQATAIALEGVEVHFLCKPSFPVERLADGIVVEKFVESRVSRVQSRGVAGKILRVWRMIFELRSQAKQFVELASELALGTSARDLLPVTRHRPGPAEVVVLCACYKEYFAPFWVWPLRRLAKQGVVIGTIAHDPVRNFVVGPLWWHKLSVRLGYSFVRYVFVHDDTPVDFGGKRPEGIQVHQIPHGPYEVAEPKIGRLEMRKRLGFLTTDDSDIHGYFQKAQGHAQGTCAGASESDSLASGLADAPFSESLTRSASGPAGAHIAPTDRISQIGDSGIGSVGGNQLADSAEGAKALATRPSPLASSSPLALDPRLSPLATPASPDFVFLAFGQIRDGKNLDLFLRAMTRLPENVKLLVAGKGDSGSFRPPEFYQKLAEELGVADRCRWDIRRIPDEDVGDIFAACDVVLVTYSAKFRSASGVLNTAVSARKPVLASSGPGPLKTVVNKYRLGIFVEPDNSDEILRGAQILLDSLLARAAQNLDTRHSTLDTCILPAWDRYELENSWLENVGNVLEVFFSQTAKKNKR